MAWKPAPSVAAALKEANTRWPDRDRASDGTIGDTAHQARPTSDHNPDSRGIVHAFDLTDDPVGGVDCDELSALLVRRRDKRVRYIIWNRRIIYGPWSSGVLAGTSKPWIWQAYTGVNAHKAHMHVSVGYSAAAEGDVSPWWGAAQEEDDMPHSEADLLRISRKALTSRPGEFDTGSIFSKVADVQGDVDQLKAQVALLTQRVEQAILAKAGEDPTGRIP